MEVMETYVMLVRWTQKGAEAIKDSPSRLEAFKSALQKLGGEFKTFYMVSGQYDMVLVIQAPNFETAAKAALSSGALGNVRTETMRAFTEDECKSIIAALP